MGTKIVAMAPAVAAPALITPVVGLGAVGATVPAAAEASTFAVGAGSSQIILFSLDQINRFQNLPNCNEAGIESCALVSLNFDAFDRFVNIFGTSLQRKLESDLDVNTKFFEVILHL